MTVRVELHEVQLRMINENIRICQSEVLLQKGSISLSQYEDSLAMNVQIGNIQLFDLTNYPSTIRQEADYILQERFCIIGI
jgi:vacuolar protein sorting-associated protein 13A/C